MSVTAEQLAATLTAAGLPAHAITEPTDDAVGCYECGAKADEKCDPRLCAQVEADDAELTALPPTEAAQAIIDGPAPDFPEGARPAHHAGYIVSAQFVREPVVGAWAEVVSWMWTQTGRRRAGVGYACGVYLGVRPSEHTGEPVHCFSGGRINVTPQPARNPGDVTHAFPGAQVRS